MSNARRILQIIPPAQTDSRITAAAQLLPGKGRRMPKWRNGARTPARAPSSGVTVRAQRRFCFPWNFEHSIGRQVNRLDYRIPLRGGGLWGVPSTLTTVVWFAEGPGATATAHQAHLLLGFVLGADSTR